MTKVNKKRLKQALILTAKICTISLAICLVIFLIWKAFSNNLICDDCKVVFKQTTAGFPILIDQDDKNDGLSILLRGEIKSGQSELMQKILQPGEIAVDVGAGFGYYTIIMASLVQEKGKVYAFEARDEVLKLLQRSIGMNFLKNVVIFNVPIYRNNQEVVMEFYADDFNTSGIYPLPQPDHQEAGVTYAQKKAFSLDNALPNIKNVSLLRISNYGAEFEVLLGALNIIRNSPQISIIIELNKNYLVSSQTANNLIDDLYDMGFEFWHLQENGRKILLTRDKINLLSKADLLITKKGIF